MTHAPYKFLDYYRPEDEDLFFGRELETQKMVGEILSTRLLVLFSPSGSGKTSLINAGVRPQLEKLGYKTIYARIKDEPTTSLCKAVSDELKLPECPESEELYKFLKKSAKKAGKPLVIFLDQFEEFFIVFKKEKELRQQFIEQMAKIKYDDELPVFLVLSLREDYFAKLHEFRDKIPSIFQHNANIRLEPFSDEAAKRAIEKPLEHKDIGWRYEKGMVKKLVKDLKNDGAGINPIALQMVCSFLWENRPRDSKSKEISGTVYKGFTDKIISDFITEGLKSIHRGKHKLMVNVFEALKTPDDTKRYRSFQDLQKQLNIKKSRHLIALLNQLVAQNILRREQHGGTAWYEFTHDYLVPRINKWIEERNEKINRKRLIYAAFSPVIIFFLAIFTYLFIQYNTFYAYLPDPQYPFQQKEIAISRRFNPFGEPITTGYFIKDVKDFEAEKVLRSKFNISFWDKTDWRVLIEKLSLAKSGEFLYYTGQTELGIKRLIEALKSEKKSRDQAIIMLVKIGQYDSRVIDALVRSLKEENFIIRSCAAKILGAIGHRGDQVTKMLMTHLEDDEPLVRYHAAEALVKLGKFDDSISKVLVEALENPLYDRRDMLAKVLSGLIQADEPLIKALIATYNIKKNVSLKLNAKNTLVIIGKFNDHVIKALMKAIKDKDHELQKYAAEVLGKIGRSDEKIINVLLEALEDDKLSVRYKATEALAEIGNTDKKLIDMLMKELKVKESDYRCEVLETLGIIGQSGTPVIEAFIEELKDKNSVHRGCAARGLIEIGKINRQVIIELKTLLKSNDPAVRSLAAVILGRIGYSDPRVIDELVKALNDKDSIVWYDVPAALGEIGHPDHRVIESLMRALESGNTTMQLNAADALGKIGFSDEQVIETMAEVFKGETTTDELRGKIVETLGKIGCYNDGLNEFMVAILAIEVDIVRSTAADALGELFHKKSETHCLNMLEDPRSGYRKAGAYALARKKSISQQTWEEIIRLKDNDKRLWVRMAAWEVYELLPQRKRIEQNAIRFFKQANELLKKKDFLKAESQYESAFYLISKIGLVVPEKAAGAVKFQQARCRAKQKRILSTLAYLKEAFQYDPELRETLKKEMKKKDSEWEFIKDNWYLNEIL